MSYFTRAFIGGFFIRRAKEVQVLSLWVLSTILFCCILCSKLSSFFYSEAYLTQETG
jgi:hypothetical protein